MRRCITQMSAIIKTRTTTAVTSTRTLRVFYELSTAEVLALLESPEANVPISRNAAGTRAFQAGDLVLRSVARQIEAIGPAEMHRAHENSASGHRSADGTVSRTPQPPLS